MNGLTLTQQYTLCAMKNNGQFGEWHGAYLVCEVAAVLELAQHNVIKFRNNQINVVDKTDCSYLQPIYEFIKEYEPIDFDELIELFDEKDNSDIQENLFDDVTNSLIDKGFLVKSDKKSIWHDEVWYPKGNIVKTLIENLRPNSIFQKLEETEALLAMLLIQIGILKKNFSPDEIEILKDQIDDISEDNPKLWKELNFIKASEGYSLKDSVKNLFNLTREKFE